MRNSPQIRIRSRAPHRGLALLALAALLPLAACETGKVNGTALAHRPSLADIDDASWQRLAGRKIFFGHQSVGADILSGIREIERKRPQVQLRIVNSSNPGAVAGPALVESKVGKNGDPASKTAAFVAAMDQGMGAQGGIAMYKYCFVDVGPDTDIAAMFDVYKTAAEQVREKYPRLTLVHITMPLTTVEGPLKAMAKSILGRPTQRQLDLKRNRFNDLLRREYAGKDPIFDLAQVESTRSDGSRVSFRVGGTTGYALDPEFSSDGAHLNELGRRIAAEQLLITLAKL